MQLEIQRRPKKIAEELISSAISFSLDFLELNILDYELCISFERNSNICGYADLNEEEITITLNPSMTVSEILTTLFHEMVHVRQMINGTLVMGNFVRRTLWAGQEYIKSSYEDLPWEVEAFALEELMTKEFNGQ
jgi:hypothetical protein